MVCILNLTILALSLFTLCLGSIHPKRANSTDPAFPSTTKPPAPPPPPAKSTPPSPQAPPAKPASLPDTSTCKSIEDILIVDATILNAGVVTDGAFARFPIYYPGRMMLQRNFKLKAPFAIPGYYLGSQWYNPNNMEIIASQTNFSSFTIKLEGNYKQADGTILPGPHSIIHSLLGGDMPDLAYSANDVKLTSLLPSIFYLHHARIDEVWTNWQQKDPAHRTYEFLPAGGFPANLDDELDYIGLVPKIKIRAVMDTLKPPLCYRYK
ncbi:hypothetical protein PtB15_18B406 [Puccinia triticina]|nr:hypothetical protein PtB15_18B406 [Puccinia triticina]